MAPYGYRLEIERPRDPAGVRLEETEAAVVRDIYARFVDDGLTLMALGQQVQRLGVASPTGKTRWHSSTLRAILTKPVYTGQILANRVECVAPQGRRSPLQPLGERSFHHLPRHRREWILVANVPAIVSPEQFAAAQERLARNQQTARRNNHRHPYLLLALVSCGVCQRTCIGRCLPSGHAYYHCWNKTQIQDLLPGEKCTARYAPARQLEELVWQDLCTVLRQPAMIAHAMERARSGHWLPQELPARRLNLKRGKASLVHQLERLTEAYTASVISLAEYQRRRSAVEARL